MKKFDKYDVEKSEWNLISKEEVSLLKMKLGKSHRKESDWEVIKEILGKHNVLTFIPPKRAIGLTTIEKVLTWMTVHGMFGFYSSKGNFGDMSRLVIFLLRM